MGHPSPDSLDTAAELHSVSSPTTRQAPIIQAAHAGQPDRTRPASQLDPSSSPSRTIATNRQKIMHVLEHAPVPELDLDSTPLQFEDPSDDASDGRDEAEEGTYKDDQEEGEEVDEEEDDIGVVE